MREPAILVLEDGTRFEGDAYGATGRTLGEVVFSTGMTGYQETLTDPSYAGQIVCMTAPHIGNTGMNTEDEESRRIWVEGFIVRDPSRTVSNFRSERSLDDDLVDGGVVGISGIDTRALTRRLRSEGSMRGGIFSGQDAELSPEEQLAAVKAAPEMSGRLLSDTVSTDQPYTVDAVGEKIGRVVILDLGIKGSTIRKMAERGIEVVVVPHDTTEEELDEIAPDGLFYSNGPGDPEANRKHVDLLASQLKKGVPFFGICFGNQLLGRALGFDTVKLPFGHRGINQPVKNTLTGRVEITAQNHGFAVVAPLEGDTESPAGFGRVVVSHLGLNDQVVEGLTCLDIPAFSVQYHPEAAAGPHDSEYLFDRFRDLILRREHGENVTGKDATAVAGDTASSEKASS